MSNPVMNGPEIPFFLIICHQLHYIKYIIDVDFIPEVKFKIKGNLS